MARRRRSWEDPPAKTVFGSASAGIKNAITNMARQVVTRYAVASVPTDEMIKMLIRPDDVNILRTAYKLTSRQTRGGAADFRLKFPSDKGEWARASTVRLRVESNDNAMLLVPDYCCAGEIDVATYPSGNVMPEASVEHVTALEHGVRDLLEVALDWAMIEALFGYLDGKPETYRKSNVRFLWAGIMPLLRQGGESCQTLALTLANVKESGWCETPVELYPAIQHANEVVARGLLLMNHGGVTSTSRSAVGFALPKVVCGELTHPKWSLGRLQPKLFA